MPVLRTVTEHKPDPSLEMPGRMGKHYVHDKDNEGLFLAIERTLTKPDIMGNVHVRKRWLFERAPYDPDMIPLLTTKNLPRLVDVVLPMLRPGQKQDLVKRIQSITHAKQRKHEREAAPALPSGDGEHRARRLSKRERRKMKEQKGRDARKELKALLRK